ncbi:MAG: helix-turn-helix transcriptional regulator [Oscillibacter sp.]|nr:helix-turn-helix transcriptional regulator [Oscillibacter sp.]
MDWKEIGGRIRAQREYLGYNREQFAEMINVTPKFCADIENGAKGMSVPTLCAVAETLRLSADYILWGRGSREDPLLLTQCTEAERKYAEELLKTFLTAMNAARRSCISGDRNTKR